jgi:hypothetical protein
MRVRYSITWQRPGEIDTLTCSRLTSRTLVARLMRAVRLNGTLLIHSIEMERVHE